MVWFWIGILVLICAVIGGYVYLVEYRGSPLESAPVDRDGNPAPIKGHRQ